MGVSNFDVVKARAFIGSQVMTQGKTYFVKPRTGADGADGLSPDTAWKTLAAAQDKVTANQNDVVYLMSEGNTAANTTDYQTTTLSWAKDGVHLIGVCAGGPYNKRARVAWASTASSATDKPLFTVSANNCYIANVSFAVGSSDANLAFGVNVTGDNNCFENVDIGFPQHATADAAGAYALKIDGCDQTLFKHCVFGSFTIDLGTAANQLLLIDSGCSMVKFEYCDFIERLESSTNSPHVRLADAGAVGFGCVWFKGCGFISTSVGAATAQNGAFKTTAAQTDGRIIIDPTCYTNAAKWDVDDADMILVTGPATPAADTPNVALAV